MKRLEELGISPTPWSKNEAVLSDDIISEINDANGVSVAQTLTTDYKTVRANNNFIAASPKLYEALYEAIEFTCDNCHLKDENDKCTEGVCPWVKRWKAALAEAAGESEVANV